jgi:hypothetical protein
MTAEIERLVRRGAASLAESLGSAWLSAAGATPASEILPGDVAVHVGHALLAGGFHVQAGAYAVGREDLRVSLLAAHPGTSALLVAEVEPLDAPGGLEAWLHDLGKLGAFTPQAAPGVEIRARHGLLAGTTWNLDLAKWFNARDARPAPPSPALDELARRLPEGTLWNGYALREHTDPTGKRWTQWLLYALFPM